MVAVGKGRAVLVAGWAAVLLLVDDEAVCRVDDAVDGRSVAGAWVGKAEAPPVDGRGVAGVWVGEAEPPPVDGRGVAGAWVGEVDGRLVDGAWVGAAEGRPVDGLAVGLMLGRLVTGAVVGGTERSMHSTRAFGAGEVSNFGA